MNDADPMVLRIFLIVKACEGLIVRRNGESLCWDDSASPPNSLFVIPNTHRLMGEEGVHSH